MSPEKPQNDAEKLAHLQRMLEKFLHHKSFAEAYLAAARNEEIKAAEQQEKAEQALEDFTLAQIALLGQWAARPVEGLASRLLGALPMQAKKDRPKGTSRLEEIVDEQGVDLNALAVLLSTQSEQQRGNGKG